MQTNIQLKQPIIQNGLDEFHTDTIQLKPFTAAKIIAYKFHSLTFYVDYEDCLKGFKYYKISTRHQKKENKGKPNAALFEKRWFLFDSVNRTIRRLSKKMDTIYINQEAFDNLRMEPIVDFAEHIEQSRCAIYNNQNIQQTSIVRQRGTWVLSSYIWKGYKYFLPEAAIPFYEVTFTIQDFVKANTQ